MHFRSENAEMEFCGFDIDEMAFKLSWGNNWSQALLVPSDFRDATAQIIFWFCIPLLICNARFRSD